MADVNQTPGICSVFHRGGQRTNLPVKTVMRGCQRYPFDNRVLFSVTNDVALVCESSVAAAERFRCRDNTLPCVGLGARS